MTSDEDLIGRRKSLLLIFHLDVGSPTSVRPDYCHLCMRHKLKDFDLIDAIYRRGSIYRIYKLVVSGLNKVADHSSVNYERMRLLTSASFTPITHAQFPVSGYTYVLLMFNRV